MAAFPVPRPVLPAEVPALLALNNRFAREVNALGEDTLAGHCRDALLAAAIWDGAVPQALLVAFGAAGPDQGPNHAWIRAHRPNAAYIDRVVVDAAVQGQGLGRILYATLAERVLLAGLDWIGCEVNLDPPNPASRAFHGRLGFARLGEATDPRNGKRVEYLGSEAARFLRNRDKTPLSDGARVNTSRT
jgi:predicted GNAT superfamily acetyltransferase